jgi:phosphopantothenoylcysteine decarboxylase/phosphopantothenate--cysteine ligase
MSKALQGKQIVLGVCGGIAAYKSVELLRLIVKQGASVRVITTGNAGHFIGPATFEALSQQPICSSLFGENRSASIQHIQWAQEADAVVIAPATANIVGKLAHGIADDALSTFMLAVNCPVMICPSMNTQMYASAQVQRNIEILRNIGYMVPDPDAGELACGTTGPGRMQEPDVLLEQLASLLSSKDYRGKNIVITAGPTREAIDPVRFISNPSSGKMGYAIARAAEMRGANVILISGPTSLTPPSNVRVTQVTSSAEMSKAVMDYLTYADILVKCAAVSDYRPVSVADQKIKKSQTHIKMQLERTEDILKSVAEAKKHQIVVGFAAETQQLDKFATEKLKSKKLDMIVGNLIGAEDAGFQSDTNRVTFYYKDGTREPLEVLPKSDVADALLDRIKGMIKA